MPAPRFLLLPLLILGAISSCRPAANNGPEPADNTSPAKSPIATPASGNAADSLAQPPISSIRFADRTAVSGLDFVYRNGEEAEQYAILESLGGGVGMFDYDQDGDLDLFFPGGGGFDTQGQVTGRAGALYQQVAPWQFLPVTDATGVGCAARYTHGAAIADADNDGFPDLLITGYGEVLFYRNQGDGTFTECAAASGLTDELWSSSAAWGDLNQDDVPDLYVAHYVNWSSENNPACLDLRGVRRDVCPPKMFEPLPDTVYFGQGDGTFRDGTEEAGTTKSGKGLGVLLADLDWDGRMDIYVANDTVPNFLYRSLGKGRFEDISESSGTSVNDRGLPDGSMGVDAGDFNLDGLPDLWVSNYERESFALYRNYGGNVFRHLSRTLGITAVGPLYVGWGTSAFDVDGDGDEDVFVANGHVVRFPDAAPIRQTALLFENLEGKLFRDAAPGGGAWLAAAHPGRGSAVGDLDQDGDLDLAVSLLNEPSAILSNETPQAGHWLQLRLIGTRSTRDALGARVTIETAAGSQQRQVKGGASYASTSDPTLHFGIAGSDSAIRATIEWPSGLRQTLADLAVDQRHTLIEPPNQGAVNP